MNPAIEVPIAWHGEIRWAAALTIVGAAGWTLRDISGWTMMWGIALAEFALLKALTSRGVGGVSSGWRALGYVALWPGMNAPSFFAERRDETTRVAAKEWSFAIGKLGLGVAFAIWALRHAHDANERLVAWVGMLGILFILHFGVLHLLSCAWRRAGVEAPPIMRMPVAATSLGELWGSRWNLAFADAARRLVFRPLARRHGVKIGGAAVFLVSGLVHETVISLPARGGWGGPTLYFLLQAAGIAVEKSRLGRGIGLGAGGRGWAWTLFIAGAPLPLLFHTPFIRHVIVPFYRALSAALP